MVLMVFDIGNLHVKGREWMVGKTRSRGLLLKDRTGGEGNGKGEEGRRGRKKGGKQPARTVKNLSRAPG